MTQHRVFFSGGAGYIGCAPGLRLEAQKVPVSMFVLESAQRPRSSEKKEPRQGPVGSARLGRLA